MFYFTFITGRPILTICTDSQMHFTRNNNVNTLLYNPEIPGFGL